MSQFRSWCGVAAHGALQQRILRNTFWQVDMVLAIGASKSRHSESEV
jgi:hypothetical protein